MKKIALFYMGGTFGCVGEPLAPMPYDQFLPQLEKVIPPHLTVDCFAAPNIVDSSACTAPDWLRLIQCIQQLQLEGYQHFVVIHGTDTLSYAAATLARFLGQSCHIVITGSQYPLLNIQGNDTREFTDAIDNLYLALEQAISLPVGTYLAFHHQVFHAQTVLKTHTTELDAFSGLKAESEFTPQQNGLILQDTQIERAASFQILNWMMQPIATAQLVQQLRNLLPAPPQFLVLQGFGTGNIAVNQELLATLDELYTHGCVPILTTQVTFGGIDQRYAISEWTKTAKIVISDAHSHADLYAKALQIYLKYSTPEQWLSHWNENLH